jgi:hypothetical protein
MTKEELIKRLKDNQGGNGDTEAQHFSADTLLIEYINDEDITREYDLVPKWYS